jgi:hypothetical protein
VSPHLDETPTPCLPVTIDIEYMEAAHGLLEGQPMVMKTLNVAGNIYPA